MTEVVIRNTCLCCDYDEQPLSELCRICWHLWFFPKSPGFRFNFCVLVSLTIERQNHLSIRLALKYRLPRHPAVPPTADQMGRCPHQPFRPEGDDTGAHTNQVEQEYRDISSCHDTETMCFLHNFSYPVLFIDTKLFWWHSDQLNFWPIFVVSYEGRFSSRLHTQRSKCIWSIFPYGLKSGYSGIRILLIHSRNASRESAVYHFRWFDLPRQISRLGNPPP